MEKPKVTVLIPTYGQAETLPKAVRSALDQDYRNLEVVIADDCSPDETEKAVAPFLKDPRVSYYRNDGNLGSIGNYRESFYNRCSGEWVLNLDGDDYLTNGRYVSLAVERAMEDPEIVMVIGNRIEYSERRNRFSEVKAGADLQRVIDGTTLFLNYWKDEVKIHHISALINRKAAVEIDFYHTDIISSDWESILRLIVGKKVGYIDEVAGVWRGHKNNISKGAGVEERIDNLKLALLPYRFVRERGLLPAAEITRWKRRMLTRLIRETLIRYGDSLNFVNAAVFLTFVIRQFPRPAVRSVLDFRILFRYLFPGLIISANRLRRAFG